MTTKRFVDFLKARLRSFGIRMSRMKAGEELRSLISRLRPVGTNYALVRLGGEADGGYLVPDDLSGITACFSPGVSTTADFELALANLGIPCFLADRSVDAPPVVHPLFDFEKMFLGRSDVDGFMTLDDWVGRKAPRDGDLLLQMDIEGAEYAVLLGAAESTLTRFRILVIEFHDLDALFDRFGFELVASTFSRLLQYFELVHIHPNNCLATVSFRGVDIPPAMEFTFLRRDRVSSRTPVTVIPHPLDRTNVLGLPVTDLPGIWWRGDD